MAKGSLGTLRQVDVRQAWEHEARNFTPWLSQNLDWLSAQLGIGKLELEDTEVQVGPYRADIVARIPQDGTRVLIENQLEDANLQHLGQVLAYLAGLEAQIIVWVATSFNEANLSAIRWLNENTPESFTFFAVQVSVVQRLEPALEVIERPKDQSGQHAKREQEAQDQQLLATLDSDHSGPSDAARVPRARASRTASVHANRTGSPGRLHSQPTTRDRSTDVDDSKFSQGRARREDFVWGSRATGLQAPQGVRGARRITHGYFQRRWVIEVSAKVNLGAPPGRIWQLMSAINDWEKWNPGIEYAERLTAGTWKSGFRFRQKSERERITFIYTIAEVDLGHRAAWTGSKAGLTRGMAFELRQVEGGTSVRLRQAAAGPRTLGPLGFFVRRGLRRDLWDWAQGLDKALVEAKNHQWFRV